MGSPRLFLLVIAMVGPILTGCHANLGSQQREVAYAPTSSDTSEVERAETLRGTIDQLAIEGAPVEELERALELLDELEEVEGESVELLIRRAQVQFFIVEPMAVEREVIEPCREGEAMAERLRALAPDRIEGHYYGALFLGLRAQHQRLRAAFFLRDLETLGRRAVELDEGYDDGGPLRFLGMFLINAPSFPYGPGDADEGVELLERAAEVSDYPLNQLLLARGLTELGEEEEACHALNEAFSAPTEGRWARTRNRWRPDAEQLATQISCPVRTGPGLASAN